MVRDHPEEPEVATAVTVTPLRIEFDDWVSRAPRQDVGRVPRFRVLRGSESLFVIDTELAGPYAFELLSEDGGAPERREQLDSALLRWSVRRIENALAANALPIQPTLDVQIMQVQKEDLPELAAFMAEKTCSYQVRDGRDLLCNAAGLQDETAIGVLGVRRIAPTSRPICHRCDLPDTDVICSALVHPNVVAIRAMGGLWERQVAEALCDKGRDEISQPGGCRAAAHPCWERIVEPAVAPLEPALSPLTLPEQLDFLNTAWRLMFKHSLLHARSVAHVAGLTLGCDSRDEFTARMRDLADVLDSLDVPADLLSPEESGIRGTLKRVELAILRNHPDTDGRARVEASISALQTIVRVRVGVQHGGAAKELPVHFGKLGVAYPPGDWNKAWSQIRTRAVDSLAVLRDEILRLPPD